MSIIEIVWNDFWSHLFMNQNDYKNTRSNPTKSVAWEDYSREYGKLHNNQILDEIMKIIGYSKEV